MGDEFRSRKPKPGWLGPSETIRKATGVALNPNSPAVDPSTPEMRSFIQRQPEHKQAELIRSAAELSNYKRRKQ